MNTRTLLSVITGVLITSVAQAGSTFSTNSHEVVRACFNTSVTRNIDTSGDLSEQDRLQQSAEQKLTCCLREAKIENNSGNFEQSQLMYDCKKT